MSSLLSPTLADAEAAAALAAALATVTERSFYAVVDPSDEHQFAAQAVSVPEWLIATVRFEDGPLAGSIVCTLPADLAHSLFVAFHGGDPNGPAPACDQVDDLMGEFSNMVCGAWLRRVAGHWAFRLSSPTVARVCEPARSRGARLWVAVSDRPLAADLLLETEPR